MVTIRASEQGLIQIDRARRRQGWLKQSEIWCRLAQTSRATLKRFWRRDPIEQGTFIAICQAAGITDWEAIAQSEHSAAPNLCLAEMPDVPLLLGRSAELAQLTEWANQCRLIVVWGIGGIGKTSLVAEWVEALARSSKFEKIVWRSLQYTLIEPAEILVQGRSLFVLDNWEKLLGGGSAGQVKAEFAAFSSLLQQIATTKHDSCAVIMSREKPAELALLEGMNPLIRSLKLEGLGKDAIALLRHRGLKEEPKAWQTLIQLYRGNPLALNMIASLIQELHQGSVTTFLQMNTIVIHQLDNVLAERIQCLAETELQVLQILAQVGRPVSREWLQTQVSASQSQLLEILLSLERRCLLEIISEETVLFALAPIVQKYIVLSRL